MKTAHVALIAVFTLFAGSVGGYLLGVQSAPSPGPRIEQAALAPADPAPDKVVAQNPETKSVVHAPSQPVGAPTPADRETEPAKPPSGALQAWIRTLADEVPQPGTGRIWGRVATAEGTPVAGATITATPRHPDAWSGGPDATLEETLDYYGRRVQFARAGRAVATTDTDGQYEFIGLGAYKYTVSAKADGYQCSARGNDVEPNAEVNFTAKPMGEIELDVRLPDGTQPTIASVSFAKENSKRGTSWSPANPRVQSDPGKWLLTVTAGEKKEYGSDEFEVELKIGEPSQMTIQLRRVPGIICKVTIPVTLDHRGSLRVSALPNPPAEPPSSDSWRSYGNRDIRSESIWSSNVATFSNLKPGRWRLVVGSYNKVLAWKDVDLGDELLEVTLELSEPEAKDYIVARVYSPSGELVRGATFQVMVKHGIGMFGHGSNTISRPDGSYWLARAPLQEGRKDDEASYEITIETKEYGKATASYPYNGTHELEIRMAAPASLTIVLPGAMTHPYKDRIQAQLSVSVGENGWSGISPTGAGVRGPRFGRGLQSETLKYGPLAPGKYRFTLSFSDTRGSSWFERQVGTWELELTAGEVTQTCPLPTLCKLTLRIADPSSVKNLQVKGPGDQGYAGHLNNKQITERTEIDGLPVGDWLITTRAGEMKIRLAGDTETNLDIAPYSCLRVGKLKAGGRLEELGFRDGDLVIRVDGQEAETVALLRAQTQGAMAKESTTWTLLRGGAQVDLTFSGKALMEITSASSEGREYLPLSNASR